MSLIQTKMLKVWWEELALTPKPQGNVSSRLSSNQNKTLFPKMPEGRTNQPSYCLSLLQLQWVVDVFQPCSAGSYALDVSKSFIRRGNTFDILSLTQILHSTFLNTYLPLAWHSRFLLKAPVGASTLRWPFLKLPILLYMPRSVLLAAPSAVVIEI